MACSLSLPGHCCPKALVYLIASPSHLLHRLSLIPQSGPRTISASLPPRGHTPPPKFHCSSCPVDCCLVDDKVSKFSNLCPLLAVAPCYLTDTQPRRAKPYTPSHRLPRPGVRHLYGLCPYLSACPPISVPATPVRLSPITSSWTCRCQGCQWILPVSQGSWKDEITTARYRQRLPLGVPQSQPTSRAPELSLLGRWSPGRKGLMLRAESLVPVHHAISW